MKIIAQIRITDVKTMYHIHSHTKNSKSGSSFVLTELEFRQFEFDKDTKYEVTVL